MASKTKNVKRPENMQHTLRIFVSYLGRHKFMLLIVSILVTVSALANLLGTYMIRPVVNNLANGDLHSLASRHFCHRSTGSLGLFSDDGKSCPAGCF